MECRIPLASQASGGTCFTGCSGGDRIKSFIRAIIQPQRNCKKTDRVAEVRNQYIDDRCPNTATLNQGSFRAAYDSAMASPPSGTQTEVGGFEGTISTNGDTSTFTINNPSSLSSWNGQSAFGGGHSTDNMYGAGGPGNTVNQKFQWAEVGLCHR
jgi:hypothetical protein